MIRVALEQPALSIMTLAKQVIETSQRENFLEMRKFELWKLSVNDQKEEKRHQKEDKMGLKSQVQCSKNLEERMGQRTLKIKKLK